MAFYVYNIQNCTTSGQIQAYTDELGASNLTPGQTVVKIGNICYSVLTYIGYQQTAPAGAIDMTQFTDPSLLWSDCASCINPTQPPSGGGGGGGGSNQAYFYNLLNCSTNQPFIGYSYTNTIQIGKSYKVAATCYRVLQIGNPSQGNPVIGNINLDGVLFYDTCAICQNPQGQPSGGGGGGGGGNNGPTQTFYYEIKACSELNNPTAPNIKARRVSGFADLNVGESVKGPGGTCFSVMAFVNTPSQPLTQYDVDLTNQSKFENCTACNALPPPVWRVQYTLQRCDNPNLTIQAYRLPDSTETPGVTVLTGSGPFYTPPVYKINNICYTAISIEWAQGPPDLSQPNVGNLSAFITCQACNPQLQPIGSGGSGSPTAFSTGWQCLNGTCASFQYDPLAGDPPFFSQSECQNSGCETGQGFGSNNGGTPTATFHAYVLARCSDNSVYTAWSWPSATIGGVQLSVGTVINPIGGTGRANCYRITSVSYNTTEDSGAEKTGFFVSTTTSTFPSCVTCAPTAFTGYNCENRQCKGTTGPATYATEAACLEDGCGYVPPISDYYVAELLNCLNSNDKIFGYSTKPIGLSTTYQLLNGTNTKCYSVLSVNYFTSSQPNTGQVNLEGKFAYADCLQCLPADDDPCIINPCAYGCPKNCDLCPGDPNCFEDPCLANPCSLGCPKNCAQCPSDTRCRTVDPCEEAPEPVQGENVYVFVKVPGGGNPPPAESFIGSINECWQRKYCVCRSQPDPIKLPNVYEYKVCLCNPENNCPIAGSLVRYECRNSNDPSSKITLEKWAVYNNGSCSTYDQIIETNSTYCGAITLPDCPKTGTLIRTYCIGFDKYGEYNDGKCGKYIERAELNSKTCGYIDKPKDLPDDIKIITEPTVTAKVYYPINVENTLKTKDITSFALWSGDTPFLTSPSTSSAIDPKTLDYILHVYDRSPDTQPTCSAELQYNIIYADYEGKGAADLGGYDEQTLSKAMYTQYAHVLLPHGQKKFNFNGEAEDYVYIIDIARKRFKQSLDPGNWELTLASCSFSYDVQTDSILQDMFTSSYNGATITFADIKTKRPTIEQPIYLSSKSYDILIGTIEDGIGSNYVTSSFVSESFNQIIVSGSSNASSYIKESIIENNNTVLVQGTRAYYWGVDGTVTYRLTNSDGAVSSVVDVTPPSTIKNINPVATLVDSAYTMSLKEIVSTYGIHTAKYEGSWTGSFALPVGATLSPTVMSGSCSTEIVYNSNFQPDQLSSENQVLEGRTFPNSRNLSAATTKQQLTVNSVTYNGNLKWRTTPLFLEYLFPGSVPYNTPIISGSYEPNLNMVFVTDTWAFEEFLEDPTDPKDLNEDNIDSYFDTYSDLDNGFILIPVRRTSYGRVYPSHGIIVLSGKKLDGLGFNTNRSIDRNGYNTYRLYHSMKLILDSGLTDLSGDPLAFYARGVDIKHSSRYFVTLKNSHLTYSNNPTYVTGSEGDIREDFIYQNKAYFSSIGLYNADKNLLAIGKISKPIMSSLTDEMLFTVKITQ